MIIYKNTYHSDRTLHIVDRQPETEDEWKDLQKWFPRGVVTRKSNGHSILFIDAKLKNFNWYE